MKKIKIKIIVLGLISLLFGMGITPNVISAPEQNNNLIVQTIEFFQEFSNPKMTEQEGFLDVTIQETNSYTRSAGKPLLPIYVRTFEFPLGSEILEIKATPSIIESIMLEKPVRQVPLAQGLEVRTDVDMGSSVIIENSDLYPSAWWDVQMGAGLNIENEHVLFVTLRLYPVRYNFDEDALVFVDMMEVYVSYAEENRLHTGMNGYDLVIITPSEFTNALQPLVNHKDRHEIVTNLVTLDDIYGFYPGRDDAEQIKYFIKYAIETWDIEYVLLVGDIQKLPIRTTYAAMWGDGDLLSDLYYADVYDEHQEFCSWDGNNNSLFGEVYYTQHEVFDLDDVDLYADVHIGRLACPTSMEVSTVVDKIITYETETYGADWFQRLVLCGGDTFPFHNGLEGEIANDVIAGYLPDFTPIRLWTSTGTYNWINVNREINKGAGFMDYSGHGFEVGMSTHPPDDDRWIKYRNRHLLGLINQNKLPIVFFDACLTATLDFSMSGLLGYLFNRHISVGASLLVPPYGWNWVKSKIGGAIATIGATREAYTNVDHHGVYGGAGLLSVNFFRAYEEGITVSQMLTQSQNDYINEAWKDFFTIEEFILLGDPSLRVGGYPPQ